MLLNPTAGLQTEHTDPSLYRTKRHRDAWRPHVTALPLTHVPRQQTCVLLILRLVGVQGHDLHRDGVAGDGAAQPRRPDFVGLHVFLHVGLLGKGSATHDALEGLLPCVTEGRRHRISSRQREEAAPGQGPWWGGCCRTALGTLCLADQHLDQVGRGLSDPINLSKTTVRGLGETSLAHICSAHSLGVARDQRKKWERKIALQQHQGIWFGISAWTPGTPSFFSRVQASSSPLPLPPLHTWLLTWSPPVSLNLLPAVHSRNILLPSSAAGEKAGSEHAT